MPTLDCYATRLRKGAPTRGKRATYNVVCLVVSGEGRSTIGDQTFDWSQHDVFTIPPWTWARHEARGGDADLFMVTDKVARSSGSTWCARKWSDQDCHARRSGHPVDTVLAFEPQALVFTGSSAFADDDS